VDWKSIKIELREDNADEHLEHKTGRCLSASCTKQGMLALNPRILDPGQGYRCCLNSLIILQQRLMEEKLTSL
jgi:hypothetical protein